MVQASHLTPLRIPEGDFAETWQSPRGTSRANWDDPPANRWSFSRVREYMPTTGVRRGTGPASPLAPGRPLPDLSFPESTGRAVSITAFLERSYTDSFIVVAGDGAVLSERYRRDLAPSSLHLSMSMAKSVTAATCAALVAEGRIDPAGLVTDYLPELAGTAYAGATIEHLLDMRSGVAFSEIFDDPNSDMTRFDMASGWRPMRDEPRLPRDVPSLIATLRTLEAPHGSRFSYRSIETDVLALCLERAGGQPFASLVSTRVWEPMGTESDGAFIVDTSGYALAQAGFNATLRDWARFGLLHLHGGWFNGKQILPTTWFDRIEQARSSLATGHRVAGEALSYANKIWLPQTSPGVMLITGAFGQLIYVDCQADMVMVKLSSWNSIDRPDLRDDTWLMARAIAASLQ